jgi:hypothetical protein
MPYIDICMLTIRLAPTICSLLHPGLFDAILRLSGRVIIIIITIINTDLTVFDRKVHRRATLAR